MVATLLSVYVGIALALGGFGYWALVWKEVAQSLFLAVGTWALCPWVPSRPRRRVDMGRLLSFGRDLTLTEFVFAIAAQLDSVLIGRFGGAVSLGLYRQAYNLFMGPIERLNAPILGVSQPTLSILQFEPDRYRRYYERILLAVSLATIPIGVFTAISAREIVLVALGEEWIGSVVFLRISASPARLGHSRHQRDGPSHSWKVRQIPGRQPRIQSDPRGFMLVGATWGVIAIAAGRLVTLVLVSPWALRFSFAGSPVSVGDFLRTISRPVVASLVMGGALFTLQFWDPVESALVALSMAFCVAAGVYFLTFVFLPGGRRQLESLLAEVFGAVKAHASKAGQAH